MVQRSTDTTDSLFEVDETAWLAETADLVRQQRWDEVDTGNLAEFLTDMARRDKREVLSRLAVLIAHLLKWRYHVERRSGGWQATVEVQRQELSELLESGTLRNHAEDILAKAYANGLRQVIAETQLGDDVFPSECPFSLDGLLTDPLE